MGLTGIAYVIIDGERLELRYTWKALELIKHEFGEDPDIFDAAILARFLELGINRPEWTAERITEASPPIWSAVKAVQEAMRYAYFGDEAPPPDSAEKKSNLRGDGLLRRMFGQSVRE